VRFRVVRHIGVGLPAPSCPSTGRRWASWAVASFDTSPMGSPCLRSFQHISGGFPVPSCLATHRRWAPCAFASLDTSVLDSLHLRVFRHVGVGLSGPSCLMSNGGCSARLPGVGHMASMLGPLCPAWCCAAFIVVGLANSALGCVHCRWVARLRVGPILLLSWLTSSNVSHIPHHQVSQLCVERGRAYVAGYVVLSEWVSGGTGRKDG